MAAQYNIINALCRYTRSGGRVGWERQVGVCVHCAHRSKTRTQTLTLTRAAKLV